MAALMDPCQPKGHVFTHHYPDTTRDFDDRELDEGDIVRSKPRAQSGAYLPLVNESYSDELPHEAVGRSTEVYGHREADSAQLLDIQEPPNGQIPMAVGIASHPIPASGGSGRTYIPLREELDMSMRIEDHVNDDAPPSDDDSDSKGLDDSTTALLRRYTLERNGRPTSIHLSPSGEIVGSGWLSEILISGHKKCAVTLEEDSITWRFLSRKDGEL
jgi:hypothetical protein